MLLHLKFYWWFLFLGHFRTILAWLPLWQPQVTLSIGKIPKWPPNDVIKFGCFYVFIKHSSYECFILRARRLSSKLLKQGYLMERLKSSFRKFYGRYGDLVEQYGVTLSRMLNDILTLDQQWPPYQSDFPPISWPLYRAWPSPNYEWFPWSICNGCG